MMRAIRPGSLAEAVAILAEQPDLVPVAGCTDLMVANPVHGGRLPGVLDVTSIEGLRGVDWQGDILEIGSATTFSDIATSTTIECDFPALVAAARRIGGWQIQNRATLGGNIANASPAGDSLPVLLALDAELELVSRSGKRRVAYRAFHLGYRRTDLQPGELIARIRLRRPSPGVLQQFRKVGTREAHAISKIVVALVSRVEDGRFTEYRLAAGSVAPVPTRLTVVEEALVGRATTTETADLGGRLASEAIEPIDDVRSTAAYRRFALGRVVRRMTLHASGPVMV